MTREAELLERPDAIPIQINFIPCDAMPGRNRMRMMIIMPAFAKGEDRDPPVVGGEIVVTKRREPQVWVMEFTIQVLCRPTTVRTKIPHSKNGRPPKTSSTSPSTIIGT